ncbi:N-acetylmuramoyl-L-alanine amidase AmiC precursor [Roseivivax jejudonensis]|uniref:N-acetylmuramoyl-L-alanine amidase n=1 Tax=Roseivivax jejudonensis TaxID=1529041 RepID=A0A1X6YQC9_9RHOB|nr:N-acetylmuramoyl-L-alanine amidase [Roseivivax jejudonensis]SLN27574.1 N-acetylmuramoyl-L-alanine amidase AmiC precursor [Roseivivax jejudonensis]
MRRILAAAALICAGIGMSGAQAQDLGALARIDPENSHVRDGRLGQGAEIRLSLSQGVPWRLFTLDDPRRLVIDFREVDWGATDPASLLSGEQVQSLRIGAFRAGWSRLVADLASPMEVREAGLEIARDSGAAVLRIVLSETDAKTFAASAGAPRDRRFDLPEPARVTASPPKDGMLRVMLDPGHGGIDPGAEHGGATEADLMLLFARELEEILMRAGQFEVELTRKGDIFMSLEARVAAAHRAGAEVFVSLHADAIEEGVARGASVYTLADDAEDSASRALVERHERGELLAGLDLSGADDRVADVLMDLARLDTGPRSRALAEALVAGIDEGGGAVHKRPMREAGFSVLKAADIPSVLLELGFLSTDEELRNMQDPEWRRRMAEGIRDGLAAWAESDEARSGLRLR